MNFTYDDTKWSDRLIKVEINGQVKELKYDILYPGNPTFYGIGTQGIEYTWEGRRLVRYKDNIKNLIINNTYNDQGLRTKKIVNNVLTVYYYEGSKLVSECTNNKSKYFLYDENNLLYGLIYNNDKYFYIRDILGNILGLIDNNGYTVVKYEYTAFGNILSISGTLKDTLGKDNPFIYKGYYYDFETSLYYCNSRYYVPEWGRWLNADDVSYLDPKSINGLNLYAYCYNNPIMYIDPNGTMPNWLKWTIGGIIIGGSLALTFATAGSFAYGLSALASVFSSTMAVNGAAAFFAGAFVGSALFGAGGLFIGGLIAKSNGDSFWDGAADGFMIGSGIGFAVGGAWGYTHYALQNAGKMAVSKNLESLVNNPLDEFVINGPYDKAINHWTKNLAQNPHGYNTIPNLDGVIEPIRVVKGTTQIANGHHRIMVLKKLGVKTIQIFYTL